MRRRQFTITLLACFIAMGLPAKAASPQNPSSQQTAPSFHVVDFDWVDAVRARQVPARLYWPADVPSAGVPLIVFSHGMGGSRGGYTYLAKRWADRGVASLHVQHIGSDSTVWRGDPFALVTRLHTATQDSEAAARVRDLRFALDRILSKETGPYAARIDRRRIVAAGHSYGANTALLAVGARVIRNGRWIEFRDARYSAAIVISAPPFFTEKDLTGVLARIAVPTLHITATADTIALPGLCSPPADRIAIFSAVPGSRKLLALFRGGSHSMFTDRSFTGGLTLNPKVKAATADLALAFLARTFSGDPTGLNQWNGAWSDILAQPLAPTAAQAPVAVDWKTFPGTILEQPIAAVN
jgi:predicted dienelactone hydrolase